MAIHKRGEWAYDLNIWPWDGKFLWHVVRLKVDPTRDIQLVGTGIAATREEAEREGVAVVDDHSKHSA